MMGRGWVDPPGVVYAISYALAAFCYTTFIRKAPFDIKRILMRGVMTAVLIGFMLVTDGVPQEWFLPCMAVSVVMVFLLIYVSEPLPWKNALYYSVHMFIVGELIASLEWQVCYFIMGRHETENIPLQKYLLMAVTHLLICALIFVILAWINRKQKNVYISERELLATIVIAMVIYALSNLSYVTANTPFSAQLPREIFNIHTWVDLGGVAILTAYHAQLCELKMKMDFDNMQNILDMQYANYQISKKTVDMVNQKYHDLKHQIAILRSEFGSKEAMEQLDKMQKEIEAYEAQNKTGNKILDTILTSKSLYCQANDIKLTCVIDGSALDFMDIMDLSSLFGNALDNAIESVNAILDKEKKLIHVAVSKNKGFIRIRVENCYGNELDFENGLPKTTKNDRNYHGYGLKSIRSVVHKYNGTVTIEAKDGWFELRILIPVMA